MALTQTTAFMSLVLPVVGQQIGPTWAQEIDDAFTALDSHDHSPGKGTYVTPAGMSVNADLSMAAKGLGAGNGNNLTFARTVRFDPQPGGFTPAAADRAAVYVRGNELYYVDLAGNQVRMTLNGVVDTSGSGSITGMGGTTASVAYSNVSKTFTFAQAANQSAGIDAGSLTIHDATVVNGKGVTLVFPNGAAANYTLTFPTATPAASELVWVTSGGVLGFGGAVVSTSAVTFSAGLTSTGAAVMNGALTANAAATFNGNVIFSTGTVTLNNGLILPPTAVASITAPPATNLAVYQDSLSGKIHTKANGGQSYPIFMAVSNKQTMASITTVETVIAGGKVGGANTPQTDCKLPANALVVGSKIRVTVHGQCTSTVANNETVRIRIGPNGTTADAQVAGWVWTPGTGGFTQAFKLQLEATVLSVGAAAVVDNLPACGLAFTASASGFNNVLGANFGIAAGGSGSFDTTIANYISCTLVTAGATTTIVIQSCTMEII